jgi:hypothetical protein
MPAWLKLSVTVVVVDVVLPAKIPTTGINDAASGLALENV